MLEDDDLIKSSQVPSKNYCDFSDITSSDDEILATCPETADIQPANEKNFEQFAPPKSDYEVALLGQKSVPKAALKSLNFACGLFEDWGNERNRKIESGPYPDQKLSLINIKLEDLHDDELGFCLSRFISEV